MCAKAYKFISIEDITIQTKILNKPFISDWLIAFEENRTIRLLS